jgi:hypothetical protein
VTEVLDFLAHLILLIFGTAVVIALAVAYIATWVLMWPFAVVLTCLGLVLWAVTHKLNRY